MQEIFAAIKVYARAYQKLEEVQRRHPSDLPRGDQKTGVIAEFYGRLYAKSRFPSAEFVFGTPSEYAWDIRVVRPGMPPLNIQIKAVSAHAEKSRVSPLHPGWDELWLMRLDEKLMPEAFWTYRKAEVDWSTRTIKSSTMPDRDASNTGSAIFRNGRNELPELLQVLMSAKTSFNRTRLRRSAK